MDEELLQDISFLLQRAEQQVWKKHERLFAGLLWEIGFQLRDVQDIRALSFCLSRELAVEPRLFEDAYHFYWTYPIKKRALEVAA